MVAVVSRYLVVARSADLRLQVVTDLLRTRWKSSSQQGAGWTPWQPFPAEIATGGSLPNAANGLVAAQLASANSDRGPGTGRIQIWTNLSLYTTTKSSELPDAPWLPWEPFTQPPPVIDDQQHGGVLVTELAVVPLADGRLQLWANTTGYEPGPYMWSTVMMAPDQPHWTPWKLFTLPGLENPNSLYSLAAAPLATGQTQLWGLSTANADGQTLVYTAIRDAATGDTGDPLSGWGSWGTFEISAPGKSGPPTVLPPAEGLLAAEDGQQRTYLWFNAGDGQQNNWMYTYNDAAAGPDVWNPALNFPTPGTSQGQSGNYTMSAAPLPQGDLQLFYVTAPAPPGEPVVWTRWQQPGQAPSAWTQWYSFQ